MCVFPTVCSSLCSTRCAYLPLAPLGEVYHIGVITKSLTYIDPIHCNTDFMCKLLNF